MRDTDIAIVGMACRFPGASSPEDFWRNIRDGVISIRRLTREELLARGADEAELDDPAYVPVSAVLDDVEGFDAAFFGYGPRDAAILDPQHRHFLEVAWQALEHAGHAAGTSDGRIGVFAGSGLDTYLIRNLVTNPDLVESTGLFLLRHTGNDKDFLATEVSYKLNLTGPSVNIQTACSTSLVAVHLASQSLLNGECDFALAGGSTIEVPFGLGYRYHEGEVLSPDGVCRPFDAGSRGTVLGSGTGAVVLRRLRDAIDDGDTIYAVVRGSAINNDGSSKVSYLAPSVDGHAAAISEALGVAEVGAETISYFESHGTGTAIGDPIEMAAATQAFRENGAVLNQYCRVGSTKANIGHLDTAAGVASIIKTAMALHHRQLPPLPTLTEPSPEIDFPSTPFYLSATAAEWQPIAGVRRAGVSSLGIGGTNAHVILEGWSAPDPEVAPAPDADHWHILPLAARSEAAVDALAMDLARFLRAHPESNLADVAFTLQEGRAALPHRRVVVARTTAEAITALEEPDRHQQVRGHAAGHNPEVVFMFPGGGSQYPQMARELYEVEPVFRLHADACFSIIERLTEADLRPLVFPDPAAPLGRAAEELSHTAAALPAIFTIEYALAQLWMARGVEPAAMTGHSLGEYTAACLAGVMSLEDALRLVVLRARLVDRVSVSGGMMSVAATEGELGPLPPGLSVASVNAPGQCVVSGDARLLDALEADLAARDISHQRLQLTAAGHSAMLDPILDEFLEGVSAIELSAPARPYVSNVTGTWVRDEDAVNPLYWVRHLRQTVRFAEGMQTLLQDGGCVLLEVGPGQTLRSLASQQSSKPLAAVSSIRHRDDTASDRAYWARAFGQLWATGVKIDWSRLRPSPGRRVSLPTYPFEHQRHWIEPGRGAVTRTRPTMDTWFARPTWETLPLPRTNRAFGADERWLILGRPDGIGWGLARALRSAGQDVVCVEPRGRLFRETNSVFAINPVDGAHYRGLIGALRREGRFPTRIVHTWLADSAASAPLLDRLPAAQRFGFDALMLLAQALIEEGVGSPVDLTVVTAGASGPDTESCVAPEGALVQGIARVLPREAPEFTVRTVDIGPDSERGRSGRRTRVLEGCGHILDELAARSEHRAVSYRSGNRWVRRFGPLALSSADGKSAPVRAGGTYLITGGLGGIGLTIARELARYRSVHLVLLSRGGEAGASAEAREAVRDLESRGAHVMLLAADVANPASMETAIEAVHRAYGPVHGVVHAAGVTRDAPAATKTLADAHDVLRPKVLGTAVLDRILEGEPLDWFLLCSSTSALVGPAGQVDYVAANAFLDAFAHSRRGPGRTVAVNWGIWRDVGMLGRRVPKAGDAAELHPLLGHLTGEVAAPDLVFEQRLTPATHWPLGEHRLADGTPLLPGSSFLELAGAAASRAGVETFELDGLTLIQPVWGSDQLVTSLRVRLEGPASGRRFVVQSQLGEGAPVWRDCAEATLRAVPASGEVIDVAAIEARLEDATRVESYEARSAQELLLRFGPRWRNLSGLTLGAQEALGRIELASEFFADLPTYRLHPALLDTAIGLGLNLLPPLDPSAGVFIPVSYRRVVVSGAVPASIVVHVVATGTLRLPEDDFATFDVRVADSSGRVVLAVEQVTFQRVQQESLSRPSAAGNSAVSPLLEIGARQGISPREGAEVFTRVLAGTPLPQVVASSIPLATVEELVNGPTTSRTVIARPGGDAGYVEPRDDVERTIAGYFSDLLGVERVSIDDHFFDLGGHSLIAIRLFSRLRQTFGLDLGLAALFEAPTVERLAALVPRDPRTASAAAPSGASPEDAAAPTAFAADAEHQYIVPIQPSGTYLPFYCVHGRGGNVLELRDLSRRVGADVPFFGIQARGVVGRQSPHTSIEEMARDYVRALLEARPQGPYLLGGYSGGGVVALEMAQQLRSAGYEVAGVVLIDSYHPALRTASARGRYGWILDAVRDGGPQYLALLAEESARRHLHLPPPPELNGKWRLNGSSADPAEADPEALAKAHGFADLSAHFVDIQSRYHPRPYDGAVTLLRASTFAFPRTLGWRLSDYPRMRIVEVQGDHSGMMREPYVSGLAAALRSALLARQPTHVR